MRCPQCGSDTDVVDSRPADAGVRRRRKCSKGHRFTTMEYTLAEQPTALRDATIRLRAALSDLPPILASVDVALEQLEPPARKRGRPPEDDRLGGETLTRCSCGALVAEHESADHANCT